MINNRNFQASISPISLLQCIWVNRQLIAQLTRREVIGRYMGSMFGLAWSFFNPVFMLIVYTFVFSVVFKARWSSVDQGNAEFALILFAGLIVHGFFSEVLSRAPGVILENANYVKKVVFPLEVLPVVVIFSALFHAFINIFVLAVAYIFVNGNLPWTVFYLPLILLPFIFLTLGIAWLLSSLGVYVRDVRQTIGVVLTGMMFLSPVFYPVTAMPADFQFWIMINPLSFIIEQFRNVFIWGKTPDWNGLLVYIAISMAVVSLGYAWFQKTRNGFADVM